MKTTVTLLLQKFAFILPVLFIFSFASLAQAPELVFTNPVLKSGTANREGATYRFSNVTNGVDAEVKLKKFSRNDIFMADVDLANLGWDKAFQPQFGLNGNVAPGQNWWVDFEINFFKAATNNKQKVSRFDLTSLDVDGDGVSIAEYVNMEKPDSVAYSSVSYLTGGGGGTQNFICPEDGIASPIIVCPFCLLGLNLFGDECAFCEGSSKIFQLCQHSYSESLDIQGPVTNFYNIDTAATQVMATYTYLNRDKIKFRIGATSGSASSTAGVRLNSMWFRSFSLTSTIVPLPVKLTSFHAEYKKGDVTLNWASASEFSFSHYEIERSDDGKVFTTIEKVKGNSRDGETATNYQYTDNNPSVHSTTLYYRLKLVDIDHRIEYSSTRIITIKSADKNLTIKTYPNPFTSSLTINYPVQLQGQSCKIELFNNGGQLVQTKTLVAGPSTSLETNRLEKGVYLIRISSGDTSSQFKVIKG